MPISTVVVISEQEEDRIFAAQAAKALGARFAITKSQDLAQTLDHLDPGGCLLFFGISNPGSGATFNDFVLPRIAAHSNVDYPTLHPELVHVIGASLDNPEIDNLRKKSVIGSFIVRALDDPRSAGTQYGTMIRPMISRLLALGHPEMRPEESCVGSWAMSVRHSEERHTALSKLESWLADDEGFSDRIRCMILTAVDELLMNAIYDAPKDENNNQLLRHEARSTPIELSPQQGIQLRVSDFGSRISIVVTDPSGTVKRNEVLSPILRNHKVQRYQVDPTACGAGIGLNITVRSGGSLFFAVIPGQKTEVALTFRKEKSVKSFLSQFRFVAIQIDYACAG